MKSRLPSFRRRSHSIDSTESNESRGPTDKESANGSKKKSRFPMMKLLSKRSSESLNFSTADDSSDFLRTKRSGIERVSEQPTSNVISGQGESHPAAEDDTVMGLSMDEDSVEAEELGKKKIELLEKERVESEEVATMNEPPKETRPPVDEKEKLFEGAKEGKMASTLGEAEVFPENERVSEQPTSNVISGQGESHPAAEDDTVMGLSMDEDSVEAEELGKKKIELLEKERVESEEVATMNEPPKETRPPVDEKEKLFEGSKEGKMASTLGEAKVFPENEVKQENLVTWLYELESQVVQSEKEVRAEERKEDSPHVAGSPNEGKEPIESNEMETTKAPTREIEQMVVEASRDEEFSREAAVLEKEQVEVKEVESISEPASGSEKVPAEDPLLEDGNEQENPEIVQHEMIEIHVEKAESENEEEVQEVEAEIKYVVEEMIPVEEKTIDSTEIVEQEAFQIDEIEQATELAIPCIVETICSDEGLKSDSTANVEQTATEVKIIEQAKDLAIGDSEMCKFADCSKEDAIVETAETVEETCCRGVPHESTESDGHGEEKYTKKGHMGEYVSVALLVGVSSVAFLQSGLFLSAGLSVTFLKSGRNPTISALVATTAALGSFWIFQRRRNKEQKE